MTTRAFQKSSIKDVARRAGVSTTTVSYFMNGREDVCAVDTAKRIRAAVDDLHYTPSSLTRGLRQSATRIIGVCLPSPLAPGMTFGNCFFEPLWRGIVSEADAANFSLLYYPSSVRNGSSSDAFLDGRVDGLLSHGLDSVCARKVVRAGMPSVLLPGSSEVPDGSGAVSANEGQTIALALDHLLSLGHRRIAHIAGPALPSLTPGRSRSSGDDTATLRLAAFTSQMQAAGIFDPSLVGYVDSWEDPENHAAAIVTRWCALPHPPSALLCASDFLALAAITTATALGVSVPGALSIVGIDDCAEARTAAIPLTSVAVPVEEIGREAVRSLLRLMSGEPVEACRIAVPVTKIVVRASTGTSNNSK